MSCKYNGRGSFIDVANMGRLEVKPGSELRVQQILQQYNNQHSVKIERAPNYVGNSMYDVDAQPNKKKSRNPK